MAAVNYRLIKTLYGNWRTNFDFLTLKSQMLERYRRMAAGQLLEFNWLMGAEARVQAEGPNLQNELEEFEHQTEDFNHSLQQFNHPPNDFIEVCDKDDVMCVDHIWRHGPLLEIFVGAKRGLQLYKRERVRHAFEQWIGGHFQYHHLYVLRKHQNEPGGDFVFNIDIATPAQEQERGFNPHT